MALVLCALCSVLWTLCPGPCVLQDLDRVGNKGEGALESRLKQERVVVHHLHKSEAELSKALLANKCVDACV